MAADVIDITASSPAQEQYTIKRRKVSLHPLSSYESLPDLLQRHKPVKDKISHHTSLNYAQHSPLDSSEDNEPDGITLLEKALKPNDLEEAPPRLYNEYEPIIILKSSPPIQSVRQEVNAALESAQSSQATKKAAREQARREKQEAKALEKMSKSIARREKQDLTAANKLKKSKKDCTPEMIIEVSTSLAKTALYTHLKELFDVLGCGMSISGDLMSGMLKLKRHVAAVYDEKLGYWTPLVQPIIREEGVAIVMLKAAHFRILAKDFQSLSRHVEESRTSGSSLRLIYVLEGVQALLRKSRLEHNRAYTNAVREGASIDPDTLTTDSSEEETIEDALLELQLQHKVKIVHTTSPSDTAEQIAVLITDISTIPYKSDRQAIEGDFCVEPGQIKTGDGQQDTMMKMLQQCRLTQPAAQAITSKYDGFPSLIRALTANPEALATIPKGLNSDHTQTGQVLGKAISLRVWKALVPQEPDIEVQ